METNRILSFLPADYPWKSSLHYFDAIDSTNLRAKQMAAQGAPHGTVLIADRQTAGKGRLGRSFHSPEGMGIYMSILLRPVCAPGELMHLTCAAAVAMCDAVEKATGLRPGETHPDEDEFVAPASSGQTIWYSASGNWPVC